MGGDGKATARKLSRRDRLHQLAKEAYEPRKATRWPYLLRDGRKLTFGPDDRRDLRADLRALWRERCPGESVPPDADLKAVIDDLQLVAERAEPDPPSAADEVAAAIALHPAPAEAAYWDASEAAEAYEVRGGSLGWHRPVKDGGTTWTPLATFDAEIAEETIRDDGTEQTLTWTVRVTTADGHTGIVQVLPDQLGRPQQWATKAVGMSALVMPGLAVADHLRVAVQSRSRAVTRHTVYTHTGWRRVGERWAYLTATGGLGAEGLDESVSVDLGPLDSYALPAVRDVRDVRGSVNISLALADIAPDTVTIPLLAAAYRAPLPLPPDCTVWLYGRSGTFKTAVTSLMQQHYGPTMNAHGLPGNWTSTANALEMQAYTLDGALFVVDDYSPDATKADGQRRMAAADRLVRGSANRAGRVRLRQDGTQRPEKPPRAQVLTSAEDVPPGVASMRARAFVAEVEAGDVDLKLLTVAQESAAAGLLAEAMARYVQWLARRYDADASLPRTLIAKLHELRDAARAAGHPRHALNVASLALGWHQFLAFATDTGVLKARQRDELWRRIWGVLCEVGANQERYGRDADPVCIYLQSLGALISQGRAYLASLDGRPPADATRWGWQWDDSGDGTFRARGDLAGWVDGEDMYLHADTAYSLAKRYAETAVPLSQSKSAVHKALYARGLLASTQGEGRYTIRKRAGGANPTVLHLTVKAFDEGGEKL